MTPDEALQMIAGRLDKLDNAVEAMHGHIVGTQDRRGLTWRVADLERRGESSWLRERGTKAIDALILGTVVALTLLLLTNGAKKTIRDIVSEAQVAAQSKRPPIPMPSDCKGCKDAVLPRSAWASDTDE